MAIDAGTLEIKMLLGLARLQEDVTKATQIVGSGMGSISRSVAQAKSVLATLGVGLSVGYFVSLIKGSIDAADHLKDLSKSTNIAVGDLAGLKLLAKQSGTDLDGLAKAVNKMTVEMGKDPDKFVKLGVTAKDGVGALKQLADIFNTLPDINQRNALAQKVFSKSWEQMAPVLSEGGKAIGETIEKGKSLSGITKEMTDDADKFNDQMAELNTTLSSTMTKALAPLLPGMNDIATAMREAAKEGGLLLAMWVALGGVMAHLTGQDEASKLKKQLDDVNASIEVRIKILRAGKFNWFSVSAEEIAQQLADLQKLKASLSPKPAAAGAGAFDEGGSSGFGGTKPLDGGAAARAAAFLAEQKKIKEGADEVGALLDKLTGKSAGFSASFVKDWGTLSVAVATGRISTVEYTLAMAELMREQPNVVAALKAQADAQEHLNSMTRAAQEAEVEDINARGDVVDALRDSIAQMTIENDVLGMTDTARKLYLLTIEREKALKGADAADIAKIKAYYDEIGALVKAGAAKTKLLSLPGEMANAWAQAGASIANSLTRAFGAGGAAAGGMFKAFADGIAAQITLDDKYAQAKQEVGADLVNLEKKHQEDTTQNSLQSYGDMAGAAASYFDKQSKGYKVLHGIEQAMFLMKFAMQAKALVMDMTATTASVANSGTRATADGIAAFSKTLSSVPFPYNLVAGALVLAALAAVGVAIAGGGGGGAHVAGSVAMQESQGTGTVFGDRGAKSESIAHAMEILRDNSSSDLLYTSRMLTALLNIESSMSGMAAAVVRSQLTGAGVKLPGAGGGNAFSLDNAGIILGRAMNPGSSEPDQTYGGQTVAQLISGAIVTGFTDIARQHTGTFQSSSYTAVNREQSLLSQEDALVQAIGRTVQGISGAIGEAVVVLTKGAMSIEEVNAILADVHIDPMSISFADLSGDALVEALSSVFSALGDTMVSSIMAPGNIEALEDFQRVGEGAFETLIRVASGVERATAQLDLWGIEIIDWHNIVNTQGDVATELIRGSIVRAQTSADGITSSMGLLVKGFDGSVDDIIGLYKTLLKLSVGLRASTIDTGLLNQAMITAAGGISVLQTGLDAYNSGFFSAEERAAAATSELTTAFAAFGAELPATRDAFRAMVEAATAAGDSALIGRLMALAPAFAALVPAIGAVTSQAAASTSPYGPYGPTELEMWTMPEAVAARAELARLAAAAEDARDSLKDWAQGLLTGPESPLDPITKMAIAQAEYAKALKDGTTQEYQAAADTMLALGMDFWSQSSPEFLEMFNRVITDAETKGGFKLGDSSGSGPTTSSDILTLRAALVEELERSRAATEAARNAIQQASERSAEEARLNREQLVRTGEQIARDVGNAVLAKR